MAICLITIGIAVLIFIVSALGLFKFGSLTVGGISGGLGAVVLVLGLMGVGC